MRQLSLLRAITAYFLFLDLHAKAFEFAVAQLYPRATSEGEDRTLLRQTRRHL